jgi:predicted short-subunit dehydrogenase-like oxidoreductase (DUF2520 family)
MKISIIGTGKVAFHLGKRLKEQGFEMVEIIGRDAEKAAGLAALFGTHWTSDFDKINSKCDLYIIAVSDDAIEKVAAQLSPKLKNAFVVHTSGTMPSTILAPYFLQFGTLWLLQSFSLASQPDFERIPIFINSSKKGTPQYKSDFLRKFAEKISPRVFELSDEDKMTLHLAAVFVNNFTNHLFKIAAEILQNQQLPFDVLLPIIEETVNKIKQNAPEEMQTGPAIRGDSATIAKHLEFLENSNTPQYELIYKVLSMSINDKLNLGNGV